MMADDANSWDAAIDLAIPLIKRFEGFAAKPYLCPAGKWTIGYGHVLGLGLKTDGPESITRDQADGLLRSDVRRFAEEIKSVVTVPVTSAMQAALISLAFNIGIYALSNNTLMRKLNACDYVGAAEQFAKWNKSTDPRTGQKIVLPGLTQRRAEERDLFLHDGIPRLESIG